MKRSRYVHLLLLGSAVTLAGCDVSQTEELKQQVYRTREDCLKDWGGDEQSCAPSNTGQRVNTYYGPRYYWDRESGRPVAVAPDGTTRKISGARVSGSGSSVGETVHAGTHSHGGFGFFGHAFGRGGA